MNLRLLLAAALAAAASDATATDCVSLIADAERFELEIVSITVDGVPVEDLSNYAGPFTVTADADVATGAPAGVVFAREPGSVPANETRYPIAVTE